MNALTVAGKEFDDAIRSRLLWLLATLFVGALGTVTLGYYLLAPAPTGGTLLVYVVELTRWLVPVAALVAGYDAVVGEREAGTLRLLFGFPYARWEVLLGKALGRFTAVVTPVVAGLLGSLLLAVPLYGPGVVTQFTTLIIVTVLLTAAFVSLAVAVSALSRSAVRVVAAVVGAFVLFLFLWDLVPAAVYLLVNGRPPGAHTPPDWYFLVDRLNPVTSFMAVVTAAFPSLAARHAGSGAFYLSGWFAAAILLAWAVVPLGASYAWFRRADLV